MTNDAQAWVNRHLSRPSFDEPKRDETPERLVPGDTDHRGMIVCDDGHRRSVGQFWVTERQAGIARYYGWRPLVAMQGLTEPHIMVQYP